MRTVSHSSLELRNVRKSYGGIAALRDVSLRVLAGSIHGVVGPNGAGKSTAIKVASGQVKLDGGEIYVSGRKVEFGGVHDALKAGIVAMPQELTIVGGLSVAENITLGFEPASRGFLHHGRSAAAARAVLDRMTVDLDPNRMANELEPAAQRVVMLARALHTGAHTVILDEPTAALTAAQAETFLKVVESLRSVGVGVVYISHRFREIERLCDEVTILRDGRTVDLLTGNRRNQGELVKAVVSEGGLTEMEPNRTRTYSQTTPVISIARVSGQRLQDVSFEVRAGEIIGLCGLPGSGVNELLEIIGGVRQPRSGSLEVSSMPVTFREPADALAHGISYLPVERTRAGMLDLTVRANFVTSSLSKISRLGFVTAAMERDFAGDVAKGLELFGRLERPLRTLSGGNRQKVLLTRCLLAEARVIVLDDPTVGVDVKARHDIHELLRRVAGEGRSVIVAASEPEELTNLADRVFILSRGEIAEELSGEQINSEELVRALTSGTSSPSKGTRAAG